MKPQVENDVYKFILPLGGKTLDLISVSDLGGIVSYIIKNPNETIGKFYGLAGDCLTGEQIAKTFEKGIFLFFLFFFLFFFYNFFLFPFYYFYYFYYYIKSEFIFQFSYFQAFTVFLNFFI